MKSPVTYHDAFDQGSEQWLQAPGFPDYAVSSFGRVKRTKDCSTRKNGTIINGVITSRGYRQVSLWREGRQRSVPVHRIVCLAFHGEPPAGKPHAAHIDGNSQNNRADNLRWASPVENEHDKRRHGTVAAGERQGASKLTAQQVAAIRADRRSQRQIAKDYGVTQANISIIKRGEGWRHIL